MSILLQNRPSKVITYFKNNGKQKLKTCLSQSNDLVFTTLLKTEAKMEYMPAIKDWITCEHAVFLVKVKINQTQTNFERFLVCRTDATFLLANSCFLSNLLILQKTLAKRQSYKRIELT